MVGVLPPTDTRWRKDIEFYELGKDEDSEQAKIDIELEQRRKRKCMEEGTMPQWTPNFFKEENHPYVKKNMFDIGEDQPVYYKLIEK